MTFPRTRPSGSEGGPDSAREILALRQQVQRLRLYLGVSLAVLGIGTLVSLGLVGFYGVRLAERLAEAEEKINKVDDTASVRAEQMRRELLAQGAEIIALRKSAADDLEAVREAQRKLAAVRDPAKELAALREANEALWSELASQKVKLLDSLRDRKPDAALASPVPVPAPAPALASAPAASASRFRLSDTTYVDPANDPNAIKGFIPGDRKIHRANNLPAKPALVIIEVTPVDVGLGQPYRLSVRLVNRSNRPINATSLRLDWSFQGMNTGGEVPVDVSRIDPQSSALVYSVAGEWTDAHQDSPVSVTATLTVDGGARLSNTLQW